MALLEDIGKALSQTGQTVVEKTRDLTEITRLSAKAADLQRKNENLYKTIGKLYVEKFGENPDEIFAEAIDCVEENKKRIAEYKLSIKQLRGVRHCQNCGAEVKNASQFCPKCGKRMEEEDVVADVDAVVADAFEEEAEKKAAEDTVADTTAETIQPEQKVTDDGACAKHADETVFEEEIKTAQNQA